jgi:hypothetical protein
VYWFGAGIHPNLCKPYGAKEHWLIFWLNSGNDFYCLRRMAKEYAPGLPQYVTENGTANDDRPGPDGGIADPERTAYFKDHLDEISRLVADGVPVRGYIARSLLDNYEWAFGYSKRYQTNCIWRSGTRWTSSCGTALRHGDPNVMGEVEDAITADKKGVISNHSLRHIS